MRLWLRSVAGAKRASKLCGGLAANDWGLTHLPMNPLGRGLAQRSSWLLISFEVLRMH